MLKSGKEFVVRFDAAERVVHLFSCFPRDWRLAEQKGHEPMKRHLADGREVAREYHIPLDRFHYGFRAVDRPGRAPPTWLWQPKIHQKQKQVSARPAKQKER